MWLLLVSYLAYFGKKSPCHKILYCTIRCFICDINGSVPDFGNSSALAIVYGVTTFFEDAIDVWFMSVVWKVYKVSIWSLSSVDEVRLIVNWYLPCQADRLQCLQGSTRYFHHIWWMLQTLHWDKWCSCWILLLDFAEVKCFIIVIEITNFQQLIISVGRWCFKEMNGDLW